MIKRILIGVVLALAIVGAIAYYYITKPEPVVDSVFRAVPMDAALLADIKDYKTFNASLVDQNQLWSHVSKLPFFNEIDHRIRFIDSMALIHLELKNLLSSKHPMLISGHPTGKDEIEYIYYIRIEEEKDFKLFDNLVHGLDGKSLGYASHTYEGTTIHDISFTSNNTENFSYLWSHGLLILSKSSILLERSVRQLAAQESLLDRKGLTEIAKTAGKTALVNLYLNFEYFPSIAQKVVQTRFKKDLHFIKKFGNWVELDLNIKPDVLILNGFSISDGATPTFELLFKNQKPQKLEIFSKVPSNANTFAVLGISKFEQYMSDYELLLEAEGKIKSRRSSLKSLKDNYNIDLIKSINEIFEQEAGVVFLNNINDTLSNQTFSLIRTKNSDDAEKMLNSFVNEYAEKNGLKINDLVFTDKINKDEELKIWSVPFENLPACLFGKLFAAGDNKFCALADNYMVFASTRDALIQYFKYLNQNLTLNTDLEFNNFSEFFSTQSNFFFYNKPSISMGFYGNFLKADLMDQLTERQTHLNTLNTIAYQFNSSENGLIYHNIFVKYNSTNTKASNDAFKVSNEIQLDANVVSKPVFFKTPSRKETEMFVQDEKNQVYLINNMGRILWKIKLPESIISDVFQVDLYKNGKQQLIFNTRTKLYALDRNGNSIEKFPVALPKSATNGLAVFDYEKNRDYRIFIAGNDRQIYAFDKKGEQVTQWDATKTESEVTQPVQFFEIAGKDYLVYNDRKHLYVVDRKGKELVKAVEPFQISSNNRFSLINAKSKKEARFIVTDNTGKVYSIGLNGKRETIELGKYPENHWFDVVDIDGNGVKDFVFTWDSNVKVFSQDGKTLFNIAVGSPISFRPEYFDPKEVNFSLGFVTSGDDRIYMYDKTGNLCKGFPLKGNTQFRLDVVKNSENRYNLMVGSENNLLNVYSVQ